MKHKAFFAKKKKKKVEGSFNLGNILENHKR